MNDQAVPDPAAEIHESYARANKLAVQLASKTDSALIQEARQLAAKLLDHVRARAKDYDDFVRRVRIAEEFSLTESRQVPKAEKELRTLYLRASSLQETADEAEARAKKRGR